MFEVRFAFLLFTREEYLTFKNDGIVDDFSYDYCRFYDDLDYAFQAARKFADDGCDQYFRGDDLIAVFIADVFNDEGDLLYE